MHGLRRIVGIVQAGMKRRRTCRGVASPSVKPLVGYSGCLLAGSGHHGPAALAAGNRPLHRGADKYWGIVYPAAAAAVDLLPMVFVVGNPVDIVEGTLVVLKRTIIVVPELLKPLLLGGQAFIPFGEDIPPGLIATVGKLMPSGI